MKLTTLFKGVGFALLCASAYARNDCRDIKKAVKKNTLEIDECYNNENGEVTKINIFNPDGLYSIDDIISYKSIKELIYHEEYGDCNAIVNKFKKLPNLEALELKSFRGSIPKNVLKNLKKLKRLNLVYSDILRIQIEEIKTLSNLEELSFDIIEFGSDVSTNEISSLVKKLPKLNNVNLSSISKYGSPDEIITGFNTVKNFTLDGYRLYQSSIDALSKFTKVRSLKIVSDYTVGEIDYSPLTKLKTLEKLEITIEDGIKDPKAFAKKLPNLKSFVYNGETIDF